MALVILDRDGVINQDSDAFVKSVDEFIFLPGSVEAMANMSKAGHTLVIATNQSGIAREYFDLNALQQMHNKLINAVNLANGKIDAIYFCPHGPDDGCDCRKPLPGMIEQIFSDFDFNPEQCFIVGDSIRDLQAGVARKVQPVLVRTGKGTNSEQKLVEHPELCHTIVVDDLLSFSKLLESRT